MLRNALLFCAILIWAMPSFSYAAQRRLPQRPDPSKQILDYYRQYPDRYIRISKESWQSDSRNQDTVIHSFTLKNTAGVTYYGIEMRFNYQTSSGRTLKTQTVTIPEGLGPLATKQFKIKVKNVPAAAEKVVASVAKAVVY